MIGQIAFEYFRGFEKLELFDVKRVPFADPHGTADLFGDYDTAQVVNSSYNSGGFHFDLTMPFFIQRFPSSAKGELVASGFIDIIYRGQKMYTCFCRKPKKACPEGS